MPTAPTAARQPRALRCASSACSVGGMQWVSRRVLAAAVPKVVSVPLNSRPNWTLTVFNVGAADLDAVSFRRVGVRRAGPSVAVANTTETPIPLAAGASMIFRGTGDALAQLEVTFTSAAGTTLEFEVNAP